MGGVTPKEALRGFGKKRGLRGLEEMKLKSQGGGMVPHQTEDKSGRQEANRVVLGRKKAIFSLHRATVSKDKDLVSSKNLCSWGSLLARPRLGGDAGALRGGRGTSWCAIPSGHLSGVTGKIKVPGALLNHLHGNSPF